MPELENTAFTHGDVSYPLPSGSLTPTEPLDMVDPVVAGLLAFVEAMLVHYMGDAFLETAAAIKLFKTKDHAVASVVESRSGVNPAVYPSAQQLSFPHLAVYRMGSDSFAPKTVVLQAFAQTRIAIDFVLPPVDAFQLHRINPYLHAAETIILNRLSKGGDPSYHYISTKFPTGTDNENVVTKIGCEHLTLLSSKIEAWAEGDQLVFPSLHIEVEVGELSRLQTDYPLMTSMLTEVTDESTTPTDDPSLPPPEPIGGFDANPNP